MTSLTSPDLSEDQQSSEVLVYVSGQTRRGHVSLSRDQTLRELLHGLSRLYAPEAAADPIITAAGVEVDLDRGLSAAGLSDGAELRISRRPRSEDNHAELGLSLVGSNGKRAVVTLPAGVPMRDLVARIGLELDMAGVAEVRIGDGHLLLPNRSLAEAGVHTGHVLLVRGIGDTSVDLRPRPRAGQRRRRVPVMALLAAAALIAAGAGVLVGRATDSSPATGPSPSLQQAARAWLAARPYQGPAWPGVPSDLGRNGVLRGSLLAASWWSKDSAVDERWIVTGPGRQAWSLVATSFRGRLAYPPTPAPLRITNGKAPPLVGQRVHLGQVPVALHRWARRTWGPTGSASAAVGLTQVGELRVLVTYRPPSGGLVWRVQLHLASPARSASSTPSAAARDPETLAKRSSTTTGSTVAAKRPVSAVGTYDVWIANGRMVGWDPAAYGGG